MSELKLPSPLLDGFKVGNAMSDHEGIRCYPAMKEGSDEKYIVKIISIPASQVQLDALLLTGAYKDPADAMDYFREVTDGIAAEAAILEKLSKLDGFLSYEGWQIVPKENGLGNEIFLLGSYKRSLERHMQRSQMSHLDAINLGLDLCQALAICRRAGYLYVDLKPSNIFISKNKEYRIGDLGFVNLDSLKYTSLPGKYVSAYSAPEGKDALQTLNTTADIYSAGMVLYQVFNDGILPTPPVDPSQDCLPPVNADYEISGIIMKAISPDPEKRWKDPMEMGQAIVGYMQRNSVNNTPLAPKVAIVTDPEAPVLVKEEEAATKILPDISHIRTETPPAAPMQELPAEEEESITPENREDVIAAQISSLFTQEEPQESPAPVAVLDPPNEDDFEPISEEALDEIPDEDENEEESVPPQMGNSPKKSKPPKPPKAQKVKKPISKKLIGTVITLMVLALLACAGMWYYRDIYVQSIDALDVVGSMDTVTVKVTTAMDETSLVVTCSDTYGNTMQESVVNGQVTFQDLVPNSQYKIEVTTTGFHALVGETSEIFNTAAQTNIVSFTAIAGPEDGSVLLNLVVDGMEPETWNMTYHTEGEDEQIHTFSGHSVTIRGLTVGKTYTFTLQNPEDSILTGSSSLEFTSTELIMAEELTIVSCSNGELTVRWEAPEGIKVDNWMVRCYNDAGFEQVLESITGTQATFTGIDTTQAYTVEVVANGMTQPIRTGITSNPITVSNLTVNEDKPDQLTVSWEFQGKEPVGGWLLMYRINNEEKPIVAKTAVPSAVIKPKYPNTTYRFEVQAADSTSIFNNVHTFSSSGAKYFEYDGLSGDKVEAFLLKTPEDQNWTYESISNDDFKTEFDAGEPISVVLHTDVRFYLNDTEIDALYIIRDANGNVCTDVTTQETLSWEALWYDGNPRYGELDLPVAPSASGNYTLEIYFNGDILVSVPFRIR